jgi:uncharacterized protein
MTEAAFHDRPIAQEPAASAISQFRGKYLSLTSYRRDGTPVATTVWFVQEKGRLLVETDIESFKVKRIRRNHAVRVAACTAGGRRRGEAVAARAELLPEYEVARVHRLITRKYRVDIILILPIYRLWVRLRRQSPSGKSIIIAITPT